MAKRERCREKSGKPFSTCTKSDRNTYCSMYELEPELLPALNENASEFALAYARNDVGILKFSARNCVGVFKTACMERRMERGGFCTKSSRLYSDCTIRSRNFSYNRCTKPHRNLQEPFLRGTMRQEKECAELHEIKSGNMCRLHEIESEFSK